MKPYFCANCESVIELDVHGRCPTCQSDAVDIAVRPVIVAPEIEILKVLEELWLLI